MNAVTTDAYWMPFTANRDFKKEPRVISGADGHYYTTKDGRRLYDTFSGLWTSGVGHCHPRIVEAITKYPAFYYAGSVGPDGFPELIMGQSVLHAMSATIWVGHILDKAWAAQDDPSYSEDEKLQTLRDQFAAEGEREETRAREDAAEARDRMLADAEFRITQEGKTARDELSREALEAALAAAETLLTSTVSAADHDRLAEEYLEQIGPALKAQQEDA